MAAALGGEIFTSWLGLDRWRSLQPRRERPSTRAASLPCRLAVFEPQGQHVVTFVYLTCQDQVRAALRYL